MADYDLGTARGHIEIDSSGAEFGIGRAVKAGESAEASLSKAGSTFLKVGGALSAVGVGVAAGFGAAIGAAANFEQVISGIKAVTGGTTAEMENVRNKALQLGKDTIFSAGEAATAIEELAKAGLSIPDIMNGAADATVALAAAGQIALPEAATIASNAMNQFQLSAQELPHIADLIAGAANASAVDVSQLGQSLAQVGAVAHTAGLSIGDTTTALAELGNAGIVGSDAGTSLKTALQRLVPQSQQAADEMQRLGIITGASAATLRRHSADVKAEEAASAALEKAQHRLEEVQARIAAQGVPKTAFERLRNQQELADATNAITAAQGKLDASQKQVAASTAQTSNRFFDEQGNIKSLADVQQILQDAYKGMTKEQQLASMQLIFGQDAIRASAVLSEQGAAGFNKMAAAMGKVSAADVAKTRMDNLKGSMEQLRGSFETLMIRVGELAQGPVRQVVDVITNLVNKFLDLDPAIQKVILAMAGLSGGALGALGGFILLVGIIVKTQRAFEDFQKALKAVQAVEKFQKALALLNLTFLANPIVLIIAGLIALGVGFYELYQHSETFRHAIDALWQGTQVAFHFIMDIVKTAVEFIKNHWDLILPFLIGPIGAAILIWRHFGDDIKRIAGEVVNAVIGFFTHLDTNISDAFHAAVDGVANFFTSLPGIIGGALSAAIGFVAGFASKAGASIGGFFTSLPGLLVKALTAAGTDLLSFIAGLPGRLGFIIGFIIGSFIRMHIELAVISFRIGMSILHGIIDLVSHLPGEIIRIIGSIVKFLIEFAASTGATAVSIGSGILHGIIDFLIGLPGALLGIISQFLSFLLGLEVQGAETSGRIGLGILHGIIDFITQLPGFMLDVATRFVEFLLEIVPKAIDTSSRIGSGILHGIVDFITSLPGEVARLFSAMVSVIASFIGTVASAAGRIGSSIFHSVVDEITKMPGQIGSLFGDALSAIGQFSAAAGEIAGHIGSNIWHGIVDVITGLPAEVGGVLGKVIDAIKSVISAGFNAVKDFASGLWEGFKKGLFGSPHTKIEYAMWDMTDNVRKSIETLRQQVGTLQSLGNTINGTGASLAMARSAGVVTGNTTSTVSQHSDVSYGGDHVELNVKTNASPDEILNKYAWNKRIRSRVA